MLASTDYESNSIQPADYCQDYPVTNYTLEIEMASTRMYIMSEGNFIVATNLSENEVYTYRLGAANSVGTVWSTNSTHICKLFTCTLARPRYSLAIYNAVTS